MQNIWSKFRTPLGWVAVVTVLVFPIFTLSGAVEMFLRLNGIDGESTDSKYDKQIEVLAWSWGASNSGGGGASTPSVQDLSISKKIDRATPALILRTMSGKQIAEGLLTVRGYNTKGIAYEALKIELKNILVTSVSTGGSAGQTALTENISLNFGSFQLTYIPLVNDVPGTGILMRWNIAAGTETF